MSPLSSWSEIEANLAERKALRPFVTKERKRSAAVEVHNRYRSDRLINERQTL